MSDTQELIKQLNERVDRLLSRIAESNEVSEKKDTLIVSMTEQLNEKDRLINELRAELESAKANVSSGLENEQLKSRINEMVREIDECISLLKVEE